MADERSSVWTRMNRRQLLRGGALAGAGLAGAALIGCGGGSKPAATGTATPAAQGTQAAAAGGPERPGVPVVKGAPKDGGTYTIPVANTSPQQDMHTALNASIWHDLSERALLPDPWTNEPTPGIVEKWETPDNTTFVLHVRKGVKLHNKPPWNGRDFDAEDLAFNINRIAGNTAQAEGLTKSAFQRAETLAGMSKVEVVDKNIVKVTMEKPSSAWLWGFLEWRNVMMPKGIVEVGFKEPIKFAGAGAFAISEYVPGVREVWTKHTGYYRQGEPHFEKVVHQVVPDQAASVAGFISKQFAAVETPTTNDEQTVKAARRDALMYTTPTSQWLYLRPNIKYGPFGDVRVRKALQLSIDYQEIADGFYGPGCAFTGPVFSGFAEAWNSDKVKTLPGYNTANKAKDIAEAQKLMAAAGFNNGDGVAFEINGGPGVGIRAAQAENATRFQAQMKKVFPGMKVTTRTIGDAAQWAALPGAKNFQMITFSSVSQPAAASEATSMYHSKGGRNYGNFAVPEADALLEKAMTELNPNARKEIFNQFQEKALNDWVPIIALYVEQRKTAVQPTIGGYDKVVGPWSQGLQYHRIGALYSIA